MNHTWRAQKSQLRIAEFGFRIKKIRIPHSALRSLLCAFLLTVGAQPGYADELPLPGGVVADVDEPYSITIGAQASQVQLVQTTRSPEQVRAFYAKALPKHGWQLAPFPWMAQFQERKDKFERGVEAHQDEIERNAELHAQVDMIRRGFLEWSQMGAKRSIYAVRGKARLLLDLERQDQGTLIAIQRWQESSTTPGSWGSAEETADQLPVPSQPGGTGLAVTPCCSGESVPEALRELPNSIPSYPNARVLGSSAGPVSGTGLATASEFSASADSVKQVAEFYRRHMAYNGWSEVDIPGEPGQELAQALGPQASQLNAELLTFRNDRAMCGIALSEALSDVSGLPAMPFVTEAAGLPATPSVAGQADAPTASGTGTEQEGPAERTIIIVNYIESPLLAESERYDPRSMFSEPRSRSR